MSRILVVEDEPGIALALEDDLMLEGYQVEVVGDGETAARAARGRPFDLILLDVMLPKKDGFEVCRELRRAGVRTPILMLTAKTQEAEKVMGLDLGADDYLTKPYGRHELRARVRALAATARRQTPRRSTGSATSKWISAGRRCGARGESRGPDAAGVQADGGLRPPPRARALPRSSCSTRPGARRWPSPSASWTTRSSTCGGRSSPIPRTRATSPACEGWDTGLMAER